MLHEFKIVEDFLVGLVLKVAGVDFVLRSFMNLIIGDGGLVCDICWCLVFHHLKISENLLMSLVLKVSCINFVLRWLNRKVMMFSSEKVLFSWSVVLDMGHREGW